MSNDLRLPSYNTPPCEAPMPFTLRLNQRSPCTAPSRTKRVCSSSCQWPTSFG